MIRSMTGYGSASRETERGRVEVEVRSVNHRHLRVSTRLPPNTDAWEEPIKRRIGERLSRGSVKVRVEVEGAESGAERLELDEDRAAARVRALRRLKEAHGLAGEVDVAAVALGDDLLRERRRVEHDWLDLDDVLELLGAALEETVEMRRREGKRLAQDLEGHLGAIMEGLDRVEELAPERLEKERNRLLEAASELVDEEDVDADRVAQEIAHLADKWDVGEELSRARSHVEGFRELVHEAEQEPVGRRMSFLAQELHRELNTTGAKGNDAEISRHVVEMKNELEGIREQVENVE